MSTEPEPSRVGEFFDDLPDDVEAWIKPELAPGERLLWAGQPIPHAPWQNPWPTLAIIWFIGLSALSATCLVWAWWWPFSLATQAAVPCGVISGVLAGLLGLGVISAVLNTRKQRARLAKTVYALTDRRAVIWQPRAGSKAVEVLTHQARSLENIHRTEYPDGTGDVVFSGFSSAYYQGTGFLGVTDVRRVEALTREVLVDPRAARHRRRDDPDDELF